MRARTRVASEEGHIHHLKAMVLHGIVWGFDDVLSYNVLLQIGRLVSAYRSPMFTSLYFLVVIFAQYSQ